MPGVEVSNDGQVRRYGTAAKLFTQPRGVPRFNYGGRIRIVAHAVAEAFLGPRPKGLLVLHEDDDKTNNHASNLRYGTKSENSFDSVRNGNHPQASKTHCKRGHPLSGDNLRIENGGRRCRACKRETREGLHNARTPC